MNLLVDIGNSRLKWATTAPDGLVVGAAIENHALTEARLAEAWGRLSKPPDRLAISCVSAARLAEIVCLAAVRLWPAITVFEAKSEAQAFGVTNAYLQPEKLGVDRWLALLAARRHHASPVCIADCGTAITLDLLDEHGRHLGGMISPGLELMRKSLSAGTAALIYED